ncbi:MAG: alpha/beta fold hydrolase [Candidatus Binatia bacterium]
MPTKYFEIGPHAVNVFHEGPSTLPDVPPDLHRGRCLLFLHGAGSSGAVWHRQLRHFSASQSPIAFDYPGHGRSSGTEALESVAAYADVAAALLDRLGVRRFVPVGTSMGGAVAMELALRLRDRIDGLVLLSTTAKFDISPKTLETWRNVMLGRSPQPFTTEGYGDEVPFEAMREGWEIQVKTDPRVRYFDLLACRAVDYRSRLGEIRVPTLVVAGAKDSAVAPANGAALAAAIPGAKHVEVPGGGHFLYRERPAELHAAIDSFLAAL